MNARRPLFALLGGLLGAVLLSAAMCASPGSPTPAPTTGVPPTPTVEQRSCQWKVPAESEEVVNVWFVVDRSYSMFHDVVSETQRHQLYLLPDLFIAAGKLMEPEPRSPRYHFSLHLYGPHKCVFSMKAVSEVPESWQSPEEGRQNEYGNALENVGYEVAAARAGGENRRLVVLLLTDGTYDFGRQNEEERKEVRNKLEELRKYNVEVYVVLLPAKEGKEKLPWEEFKEEKLVTEVYTFPIGLDALAKEVFYPVEEEEGNVRTNWFSGGGPVQLQLPGFFSQVTVTLITVEKGEFTIDSPDFIGESPVSLVSRGVLGGSDAKRIDLRVGEGPHSLTIAPREPSLLGFYKIEDISSYSMKIENVVPINEEPGVLTVSVKPSVISAALDLRLHDHRFLTVTGDGHLENGVARFETRWSGGEVGETVADVVLRGDWGEEYLNCGTITLPVKLRPIPVSHVVTPSCSGSFPTCDLRFVFRYNPPQLTPTVSFCSKSFPSMSEMVERCPTSSSYSIVCLTTTHSVAGDCVKATFVPTSIVPTKDQPIIVWREPPGDRHIYTYTIRLHRCYLEYCYERVLFQWRESPVSDVGWCKDGDQWRICSE